MGSNLPEHLHVTSCAHLYSARSKMNVPSLNLVKYFLFVFLVSLYTCYYIYIILWPLLHVHNLPRESLQRDVEQQALWRQLYDSA